MERVAEDRVAGRPWVYPPLPPPRRASATMDLFSLRVEGTETVYASEGTMDRPPLVFLHGWGASHKFWKCQFGAFSPRWRCLAPDLPGFGLAGKPRRDYSVEALARWVGSFLDALGLSRVALMAPGVRALAYGLARWAWVRRWATRDFSAAGRLDPELEGDITRGSYGAMVGSFRSLLRTDLVPRLASLSVPALSVGTDGDRIVAPGQYALVPSARKARISGAGHIPIVERPAEFNRILDEFLHPSPAPGVSPKGAPA